MHGPFFDKRFVIVAGKGGVGKSTLAAAIGLAAARRGKRTLILELDTAERIPGLFGAPAGGYEPTRVADDLYTANIQPEPALREYGLMKLRLRILYKAVFEHDFMQRFLRLLPGMNELLLMGKAWYEEDRTHDDGTPVWDLVVVDAPATGHGVSLLRLPHVILAAVSSGPMADDTRKIRSLLLDPERTVFNVVTLAEEMPFTETLDLVEQNRTVLEIPSGYLFVNQVWPAEEPGEVGRALNALAEAALPPTSPLHHAAECVRYARGRRALQAEYLDRLDHEVPWPQVRIPYLFCAEFAREAVESVADAVEAAVSAREGPARGASPPA